MNTRQYQELLDAFTRAMENANELNPIGIAAIAILAVSFLIFVFWQIARGQGKSTGDLGNALVILTKTVAALQESNQLWAAEIRHNTEGMAENTTWLKSFKGAVETQTTAVQKMDATLAAHDTYSHTAVEDIKAMLSVMLAKMDGITPAVAAAMQPKLEQISRQVEEVKKEVDKRATDEIPAVTNPSPMEVMATIPLDTPTVIIAKIEETPPS